MKAFDLQVTGSLVVTGSIKTTDGTFILSGSDSNASSSFSSRITTNESNMTLATASIAALTASISRIDSEIDTNAANITLATASIAAITASLGQPVNTNSNVTFNDINSTGTITATEIHTTFVSSSIAVASGSNNFGDAADDHHSFTGSLSVSGSGSITGSLTVNGDLVLKDNADFNGDLDVDGTTNLDVTDIDGAVDMASTLDVGDVLTVDKNVSAGDLNTAPIVTFKNSQGSGHYTALKFEGADSSGANTGFFGYMSHNTPSTRRFVISHDGVNRDFAINSGSLATFIGNINQEKAGNLRLTQTATGTGEASLHLHANNSTGDSFIRLQTDSTTFAMGIDNSDGDKFIFSVGSDPHSDSVFNIQPDGSNITFDKSTNINNSLVVSPNGAKFSVGASITGSCGTAMDVMQVGHTSQWYAETSDAADRNVYIGNNFYHDGTNHKPIYEDQVSGIQFRAGTIRFRTAGVTGLHENLDAGGGTERMRIASDGKVGIGTDNPDRLFHVQGSGLGNALGIIEDTVGNANFLLKATAANKNSLLLFGDAASDEIGRIDYDHADNSMNFVTNAGERMRIKSNGDVQFGTSGGTGDIYHYGEGKFAINDVAGDAGSPTYAFNSDTDTGMYRHASDVIGLSTAGTADVFIGSDGLYIDTYNGDNQIRTSSAGGGSTTLYIGNQSITTSSDVRIKENIVNTEINAIAKINDLRVVDFNWNDPNDTSFNNKNARGKWTGLIAQEVIDHVPYVVNAVRDEETLEPIPNAKKEDGTDRLWGMEYDKLVPLLIKAVQELSEKNEALEKRIEELEKD